MLNFIRWILGYPMFPSDWSDRDFANYEILRIAGFNPHEAVARANDDKLLISKMGTYYDKIYSSHI